VQGQVAAVERETAATRKKARPEEKEAPKNPSKQFRVAENLKNWPNNETKGCEPHRLLNQDPIYDDPN